jgi:predicted sulfurtransferase
MKSLLLISILATLGIAAGCSQATNTNVASNRTAPKPAATRAAATPEHQDDGHDAPRISLADAKKAFDNKTAVFIDTHTAEQFALEHIPGAVNIQANTIKQNLDKVPKGKKIIAYCS